jgi:hypothetical protein
LKFGQVVVENLTFCNLVFGKNVAPLYQAKSGNPVRGHKNCLSVAEFPSRKEWSEVFNATMTWVVVSGLFFIGEISVESFFSAREDTAR